MAQNKNIIICSDGTGNQSNKGRGTNVFKMFEAVDNSGHHHDKTKTRQIAFYDDGVGTNKFAPMRIASGAFGLGVARNVRQLYRQICRCYEPGDRIYMFGFSRGAYTVRTLASIVIECGLVDMNSGKKIPFLPFLKPGSNMWLKWISWRAWRAHRRRFTSVLGYLTELLFRGNAKDSSEKIRNTYSVDRESVINDSTKRVRIHFIGVWDTVSAMGFPIDFITWFVNTFIYRFSFPNQELNLRVEKACQALAIDEERASFEPVLWSESDDDELVNLSGIKGKITKIWNRIRKNGNQSGPTPNYNEYQPCECDYVVSDYQEPDLTTEPPKENKNTQAAKEARIEQVWFPGVHSDIGGGYPKQGLSYVTLDWMMEKASASGLRLTPAVRSMVKEQRNVFDKLHDSRAGMGTIYRYKPRNLASLCKENQANQRIHGAVFERINDEPKYRPRPVSCTAKVVKTRHEKDRDIVTPQSMVECVKPPSNLDMWIGSRIALHWALIALLVLVMIIAKDAAGGWSQLGSGLFEMKGSPIDALKTYFLNSLLANKLYWGKWVGGILLSIAALSKLVQHKIGSIQSTYWKEVFSEQSQ